MGYSNINATPNYQLQGFGQSGMRTISTSQAYVEGEYYRVLVATQDSTISATSVIGDDITDLQVYAGTTIYGLFTAVSVSVGEVTAYLAGATDIDSVWSYINTYGLNNGATIEAADCAKDAIEPLLDKYYAQASLVLVPSLYKTSIVYAERPLNTNGQLTFTRASEATRVGPDGYVEKVRTNLLLHSQAFDNAYWVKQVGGLASAPVVTANAELAPDGTMTADRIVFNLNGGILGADFSQIASASITTSAQENTGSVYLKTTDGTSKVLSMVNPDGTTIGITVTGTYQRFTNTSSGAATSSFRFRLRGGDGTSDSASIAAWGAQFESGVATNYIPTTTAAVSVGPVSNLPRLNYPINADGSVGCPSLLLEPQRTNIALFSEQFDNAAWSKTLSSVTANTTLSPDGYQNADTFTPTSASASSSVSATISSSAATHTMSVYAKVASGTKSFRFFRFNGTDGSVTSPTFTATTTWQRFTWTTTPSVATSTWYIANAAADLVPFIIYGAQLEVGAYATSYIPTLSTSVTRVADGTGTSDVFGTTYTLDSDFGLYWEGVINGTNVFPIFYSGGNYAAGSDYRSYFTYTGTLLRLFGVGEVLTGNVAVSLTAGTYYKILVKRVGSTIKWYVNGTEYANASGTTTTTVKMRSLFGPTLGAPNHESVAKALIFETTLSDAQGIELTSL